MLQFFFANFSFFFFNQSFNLLICKFILFVMLFFVIYYCNTLVALNSSDYKCKLLAPSALLSFKSSLKLSCYCCHMPLLSLSTGRLAWCTVTQPWARQTTSPPRCSSLRAVTVSTVGNATGGPSGSLSTSCWLVSPSSLGPQTRTLEIKQLLQKATALFRWNSLLRRVVGGDLWEDHEPQELAGLSPRCRDVRGCQKPHLCLPHRQVGTKKTRRISNISQFQAKYFPVDFFMLVIYWAETLSKSRNILSIKTTILASWLQM